MGRNLKLLITTFSLTVLYGIYYWGIPAVVNMPSRTDFIEKTVLKETGYKVSLTNPSVKMGLLPAVWIKADNFAVLNDDNSKALNINNPYISVKLLPLIFKNIDIKHLSADSINVNLIFTKDSKLMLGQYLLTTPPKSQLKLKHAVVKIGDYNVNLDDKLQNKKINLDGKYLNVNNFIENKHVDLSTIAELTAGNKKAYIQADIDLKLPLNRISDDQLEVSGHVINLDLSDFSPYAKAISKDQIKSLSGIVNITANTALTADNHKQVKTKLIVKNLGIFKDDIASSIHCKDKLVIKTDINTIKNGIEINEMKITGKGISAFSSGKVTRLNAKIPTVDLKVNINKSRAENIISILPGEPDLSPDIDLLLLKQTGFWGDVMGNLEVKGKADYPNVYGNILVSNAYVLKPIPNAEKAIIKLSYTGDKMNLDVTVPTGGNQAVYVKGPVNLDKDRNAELNITSTERVDLKTAQIVLNPLHDILHFDIGPVPVMDINGKGGINLYVTGNKKNPHGWGKFWFDDAKVSFIDIKNMTLTNGSGVLEFNNQDTVFKTKSAKLNGKPITVNGTCSLLGNLNFNVLTNGQDIENLLKIVKTSPMLADIQKLLETVENGKGPVNFKLNLTGQVKDPKDIVFNKNLFAKGNIDLFSNTIKIKGMPVAISQTSGNIKFDNLNADFNLTSNLNKSQLNIDGKIKDLFANVKVVSNKFNLGDGIKTLPPNTVVPYQNDISSINTSFIAKYNGSIENIEYNKLNLKGKIYSNKGAKSNLIVDNSSFELVNSYFKLPMLKGTFKNSPFNITAFVNDAFSQDRIVNGNCKINSLDLNLINDSAVQILLPPETAKELKNIDFLKGKVNLSARIRNNSLNAYTVLDDISLVYKPKHMKITINSGNMFLKNDLLNLNKINAQLGKMPLFIDGKIANVQKNPDLNLYINAKPNQEFFDQFFNNNALYPIKLKGDAILSTKASGTLDNLNTKSELKLQENSSLYYMGASIGDIENPVRITVDNTYTPDRIRINNLQYDKIILSQNNKPFVTPQLNASGTMQLLSDNNVGFNNFKIKTQSPTDAKIFNIIFRKPFMKQGVFTSDLVLNGTSISPRIKGKLDITSIDIPFFDSTIRDVNLDFKNDKIVITSRGTVLTNDVHLDAVMKNKLTPPYIIEDINVKLADLNINKITDTLRDIEAEATRNPSLSSTNIQPFDISQLIIQKADIQAEKIKVRNINADDFTANLNLNKDGIVDVNKFKFNIAEGSVVGNFKHNIKNHKTNLDINLDKANALIMSEALFDLKGQVYGSVNGNFNLSCTGDNQENCFKTLAGEGSFKIADGRMPKLGSLEYLLKAGNLLRGGFTGLSINSIIDLITPLKTGNFESISGNIHISEGIADKINIYSSGNDLNMYMTGTYNLVTSIADMEIYGSLSKNITTVFGKIKNASLNTLFNTIPGINDSTETLLLQTEIGKIPNIKNATDIYRIFMVDVDGDINGVDYVRSFKWVK